MRLHHAPTPCRYQAEILRLHMPRSPPHSCLTAPGPHRSPELAQVRVLDLESAVWTVPTVSGTPPAALVGHTSTLIGTELFVFGGSDGKQDGNELHMFDTETLSWSLPSLEGQPPMARVGHSGSAVGATKIYYFGGYGVRLGYVSDTYVLDTALLSWTKPFINGTP